MNHHKFLAIHKCDCGDPECTAVGLIGYGEDMETLKESIALHWDNIAQEDDEPVKLHIYEPTGTLVLQREVRINEIKVN